jgi:hypothetical protein
MEYKNVEKKDFKGNKVKVLAETYEPGEPEIKGCGEDLGWRKNLLNKDNMIKYLKNGERYFYSSEWYGSEKRR